MQGDVISVRPDLLPVAGPPSRPLELGIEVAITGSEELVHRKDKIRDRVTRFLPPGGERLLLSDQQGAAALPDPSQAEPIGPRCAMHLGLGALRVVSFRDRSDLEPRSCIG